MKFYFGFIKYVRNGNIFDSGQKKKIMCFKKIL